MNRKWRYALIPVYPLFALNVIIAFIYALVWCKARAWQWRQGVLTFVAQRTMFGDPSGQGWSWVVGFASDADRDIPNLRVHEFTHVWQELMFAWFGLIAAGALVATGHPIAGLVAAFSGTPVWAATYGASFMYQWSKFKWGPWGDAYRQIVYEREAYDVQDRFVSQGGDAWGAK